MHKKAPDCLRMIILLAAMILPFLIASAARAEDGFDYENILYKIDPASSKLTIEVFAPEKTANAHSKSKHENLLAAHHAHSSTDYRKIAKLNGHVFDTTIKMWQPQGTGFGGAFPMWTVLLKRDGKTIYDANFGHNHLLDIDVMKIVANGSNSKIQLSWIAEIDDSKHESEIDAAAITIDEKAFEKLKEKTLGPN